MSTYRAPADGERVDELVAGWAEATPSAKAVVCGARRIGYGELGRLVDAEADRLRSAGLPEGGLVAVALDRSVAALVAMLGVLRAKGAYLPLDPAMPDAELHRVLEEAGPHVVLTRESYRAKVGGRPGRRVVCVDAEAEPGGGGARPRGEVDAPPTGGGTACVFLTAGTTGRPRLVRVGHHDLAAARNAWQQVHGFDARDRHVHTAPPESPEFTANWVRALCSGGTLVLPADDDPPAPGARLAALRRLLTTEAATVLACGVPTARLLSTRRPFGSTRLRLVTVTGDVWYLDEQRALRDALGGDVRVVNAYTVTEAFGAGTCFELPAGPGSVGVRGRPGVAGRRPAARYPPHRRRARPRPAGAHPPERRPHR
ncbi:AMP-binding protein [Streptomyces somaliensis]|uniref:AMP-binding protein n=1 Tax=Streptomyces somaliensis TaxID=78355 RepID=UPI0020CCBED2|nr:AMP-binding protein [Streptomyces somaliensis]MCP9945085.1 AMP-binding protein [Streptomyces somaliensis]